MPRKKRAPTVRKLRDVLTMGQVEELYWGCFADPRNFESEAERRQGWEQHKAELLARARPGSRPSAFWRYDMAEGDRPRVVREGRILAGEKHGAGYPVTIREHDTECLLRLGLATPADLAELQREIDFAGHTPELSRYSAEDLARMRAALAGAGA